MKKILTGVSLLRCLLLLAIFPGVGLSAVAQDNCSKELSETQFAPNKHLPFFLPGQLHNNRPVPDAPLDESVFLAELNGETVLIKRYNHKEFLHIELANYQIVLAGLPGVAELRGTTKFPDPFVEIIPSRPPIWALILKYYPGTFLIKRPQGNFTNSKSIERARDLSATSKRWAKTQLHGWLRIFNQRLIKAIDLQFLVDNSGNLVLIDPAEFRSRGSFDEIDIRENTQMIDDIIKTYFSD